MRLRRSPSAKPSAAAKVLAIDPSLTSTGWAVRAYDSEPITGTIKTDDLRGPWRLHYARKNLEALLDKYEPTVVAYEGYAMGRVQMRGTFDMGELGGVYKHLLWDRGIDVVVVPPSVLKSFLMLPGTPRKVKVSSKQKKEKVVKAVQDLFGYEIAQHDEADAFTLLLIGEMHSGLQIHSNYPLKCTHADLKRSCETVRGRLQSISNRA